MQVANTNAGEISLSNKTNRITRNTCSVSVSQVNMNTLSITWTGITSTAWTTGSNWSGGLVPTENDDVIIPAGTPFSPVIPMGTIGYCNSIQVMNGAVFTIATGGILNIKSGGLPIGAAIVTTLAATQITSISAQLGGMINSIGDCAIISHGIVISIHNNPTLSQTVFDDNTITGVGSFYVTASPLLPATTYYARAYATNCKGTSYGNEVTFTTGTGGGSTGADTSFFRLTTGGITYFSYDLLSSQASTVFPEGDTRFAVATWDYSNQVFSISANSSFLLDATKSFGFEFGYGNPDVNGVGTYTFTKSAVANKKVVNFTIRSGIGASDLLQSNYNGYLNTGNFIRYLSGSNCVVTETTSHVNTLIITRWGNPGEYVEGTINGTLYEFAKTAYSCSNSIPKPYTVEFKLKRLQ